jgi:hypothetical protein
MNDQRNVLTYDQERAITLIQGAGPGPLAICGYAGTGKSWLACHAVPEIFGGKRMVYAAPTNKAARGVLKSKLQDAHLDWSYFPSGKQRREDGFTDDISLGTVFSLLHLPRVELVCESTGRPCDEGDQCDEHRKQYEQDPAREIMPCSLVESELRADARDDPLYGAEVVIIDEASMVSEDDCRQLSQECYEHGIPLLFFGDPGQLPPVREHFSSALTAPGITMETIRRQALGDPIIQIATQARHGEYLQRWDWSPLARVHGPDADLNLILAAGRYFGSSAASQGNMIICPRHDNNGPGGRTWHNHAVRQALGFTSPLPQPGDAVVSMSNDYYSWKAYNGARGQIIEAGQPFEYAGYLVIDMTVRFSEHRNPGVPRRFLALADQFGYPGAGTPGRRQVRGTVPLRASYRDELRAREPSRQEARMLRDGQEPLLRLDYGYALTAWKAQGDETPGVMVTGAYGWLQVNREAYLYTAITRAKTELAVF